MASLVNKLSMSAQFGFMLALSGVIAAVIVFAASVLLNQSMQKNIEATGHTQIKNAVSAQLMRDVNILSATLSDNLKKPLYSYNFSGIKQVIDELAKSGELDYVYVFDAENKIVHDGSDELALYGQNLSQIEKVKLSPTGKQKIKRIGGIIHAVEPIKTKGVIFGGITFGIKFTKAEQDILKYSNEIVLANDYYSNKLIVSMFIVLAALVLAVLPMAFLSAKQLLLPLQELARKSQSVKHHHNENISFLLERDDEIGVLANAMEGMTKRLNDNHQEMINIAFQDELTSLSNRRYFNENLRQLIVWATETKSSFAMLFIDLDNFKCVNDNEGHDIGDALLAQVAKVMTAITRSFCLRNNISEMEKVIIARLGGDEFVIVIPQCDTATAIEGFANELLAAFEPGFVLESCEIKTSLSIGITMFPQHGRRINELLKNADLAMYNSKKAGRGRATIFKPEYEKRVTAQ